METIKKNYKPEFCNCLICKSKLNYLYATSAKTITFTQGKQVYVKNLAYICPNCKHIYTSATASKLALKGVRYSLKVCFMIYYYKTLKYNREKICDLFSESNIFISERNIDIIYNKLKKLLAKDYLSTLDLEYKEMINNFNSIRLSIDLVSYNKKRLVIIRNFYNNKIIGFYYFNTIHEQNLIDILSKYINKNLNITSIISIRKDDYFIPLLKNLAPINTKFSSFLKI